MKYSSMFGCSALRLFSGLAAISACVALAGSAQASPGAWTAGVDAIGRCALTQAGTQTPARSVDELERERVRKMARDNAAKILQNIRQQGGKADEQYVDRDDDAGAQGAEINIAPEPTTPPPADAVTGPHIVFDEPVHDFGLVMDKIELHCSFSFKNAGTEELIIEKVNTGCGCTVANMPKQKFAPGETGTVDITYNPKGTGAQSRQIQVLSNDALQRVTNVTIAAHVLPLVEARPQTIQFGQVVSGQERKAELVVVSRDPNMTIESIITNGDEIIAKEIPGRQPVQLIEPELPGRKVVEVTLSPDASPGRILKMITVKVKATKPDGGESEIHELRVNAFAQIKGELSLQPPFIRLKPLAVNEEFKREAILTREGGGAFNVVSTEVINSTLENVKVDVEPYAAGSNKGYKIVISGAAGEQAKNFRGSVLVHTDMPKEPTVEIQFSGLVRPPIFPAAN